MATRETSNETERSRAVALVHEGVRRPAERTTRFGALAVSACLALCCAGALLEAGFGDDLPLNGDDLRYAAPIFTKTASEAADAPAPATPAQRATTSQDLAMSVQGDNTTSGKGVPVASKAIAPKPFSAVPLPPRRPPHSVKLASEVSRAAVARPPRALVGGDRSSDEVVDAEWDASEAPQTLRVEQQSPQTSLVATVLSPLSRGVQIARDTGSYLVSSNAQMIGGVANTIVAPFR